MKYIAQTISYVLHPMLMPLYILFFIFNSNTLFAYIPWGVKLYCYLVTVFALLIMPVISLPLFKYFRLIRSYELNDKQERVYPILVAVAFAFLGFWLLGSTRILLVLYMILARRSLLAFLMSLNSLVNFSSSA